ncbi:sugar kinase [Vibrio sp. JC009]|uniref:sugar kinase n=1 Tax=Vibrio sp. JC009 TaxID=2912314 RepID=UPI0023B05FA2|nr:sugar kinase [Vibrio sp. JC009]WED24600.1 sugar kinase [Vibrio sp. JC009]
MNVERIAIIGECMVELRKVGSELQQGFGGDTLNTATYLSRLTEGKGKTISYVTGLGKDSFSKEMLQSWNQENINTDLVQISDSKLPGIYAIETAPDGERSFYYWRNDSAAKYWLRDRPLPEFISELSQNQMIYISGISLAILPEDCREMLLNVLEACRKDGVLIAFDNNYRPRLWESSENAQSWYQHVLKLTDIAFLTYDDEEALWGDTSEEQAIARTQDLGVSEIVIKRGGDACFVITPEARYSVAPAPVSNIIDTTAAGDSFSAGYLAKRILGGSCEESAAAGHKVAGTVIQYRGAVINKDVMPTI